jgi:molybdopterin molybdotransferase
MPASAELFSVLTPRDAWQKFLQHFTPSVKPERIASRDALGRVIAGDVIARENLPTFRRSLVDGFAVIAADTHGASPGLPALLDIVGEAPMGAEVNIALRVGGAVLVHTGSMIPHDSNAVVMIEQTAFASAAQQQIEVMKPAAVGENVLNIGEDVRVGATLLRAGQSIRPQDIGGLMALGELELEVARAPRVAIISTGDEVVPPDQTPRIGQVRDVNSYALAAAVQQAGGVAVRYGIAPDVRDELRDVVRRAHAECDLVVLSAGSSVSARDMSVEVIGELGAPGVLAHGVSLKPGKPTIIAVCNGMPVFGLPGNPASALAVFDLFVAPTIRLCLGMSQPRALTVRAKLTRNISSATGRLDIVQVTLDERDGVLYATPIFGKSNLITTLMRADGIIKVDLDANGISAGADVDVIVG